MKVSCAAVPVLMSMFFAMCDAQKQNHAVSTPVCHAPWDRLLKKHVSAEGMVDYAGFETDREMLREYLQTLRDNPPEASVWSREQQLVYWINAYNAFTIELILRHYPVGSIKDIGPAIQIPFVNTPWDIRFIPIGEDKIDLNEIEHGILRKAFEEPEIHFAINCASKSCPALRREAYTAEKIDQQLRDQAVAFINDPAHNNISNKAVRLSKIFRWFGGDFTGDNTLIAYINRYSSVSIDKSADIDFMEYDWSLNDVASLNR